ncbi:MAG: HD domain-containing protein [Bacteroidales bacterium]|nr:HD domain-containing protein [Bacteroidales bacterium]
MEKPAYNKKKIINDPVYGFITIPFEIVYDLIEHPYFQRLRRIRQLGLTHYVYPGANHTRFQHAIGAVYLMSQAIQNIRLKGWEITTEEAEAVTVAILLHDIGHGPFSHALEESIIENINHEQLSALIMDQLNLEYNGKLDLALKIFNNTYPKKFLHQLVSSQLDMDRLDYLKRDSFFTGVTEGGIGSDRIIKMLNVVDDKLVVEAKGIYSIEDFLIARRLMYWQVYFHKTVLASENLLMKTLKRAKFIARRDKTIDGTGPLKYFLFNYFQTNDINKHLPEIIKNFSLLDDNDIFASAKMWSSHNDYTLATLSQNLINRKLPKIIVQDKPFVPEKIRKLLQNISKILPIPADELHYFVFDGIIENNAYNAAKNKIKILYNDNSIVDVEKSSDILNVSGLYQNVKKYFLCYPKDCGTE